MTTLRLNGRITEQGQLVIDEFPADLPPQEVEVIINLPEATPDENDPENQPLTDEEIAYYLTQEPKTGPEIAANLMGGWEHKGITDSVEWVKEQRRKRKEKRGW
ncbi:MAG: hypothetical protein K8L91_08480 [Anaerolineae bacterium]|nr:hypothetical protein [Anaerolineae bacterium]